MKTPRLTHEHRRAQILARGVELSRSVGLYRWTLEDVADGLDIGISAVKYYHGSAHGLRCDVVRQAIFRREYDLIGQAIVAYDPLVLDLDAPTKRRAREAVANV